MVKCAKDPVRYQTEVINRPGTWMCKDVVKRETLLRVDRLNKERLQEPFG